MIRSQLCSVVKMAVPTFNSHRRNGDLPFNMDGIEAKDGKGRTWARFSAYDAALLIAAKELTSQGVMWREATKILRSESIGTGGKVAMVNDGMSIARITFANGSQKVMQGPVFRILPAAERIASAHDTDILGVIAINVSQCLKIARQRMLDASIPLVDFMGGIDPDAEF